MHARHRSPGNGYPSGSMGMGMSQEGSARGHGFYNSEYRSFNRGFGRGQGQPKSFQQPPQTPRKGDIFMEAGRLAVEYLVSQGQMPPNTLSGKWQNGTLRPQDGDNLHLPPEGRSSVLTRLGSSMSDVGAGRKRYPDDYNQMGLRNYLKGRRKGGSFRNYGSEWGKEYGRSGSWSERGRVSPEMEGDDDSFSGHQEEQQVGKGVGLGLQKSSSGEFAPKRVEAKGLESESEKYNIQNEMGSRASSSSAGKDLLHETDGEFSKKSDDSINMDVETGELKDGLFKHEIEEQDAREDTSIKQYGEVGDTLGKSSTDLVTLCKFARVPTRTRSSLTYKGVPVDSVSNNDDGNTSDIKAPIASEVIVDNSIGSSTVDLLSNKTHDKCPDSEISESPPIQSVEGIGALGSVHGVEQGKCARSQSFPSRALMHDGEQESGQGLSGLQKSISMVKERGEKRTMEENDTRQGNKKLRDWFPSMVVKAEECFDMSNLKEKKASSQEQADRSCEQVTLDVDQESLVNDYRFSKGTDEPCIEYAQEKQLFPGSFKICDLNLMETSDINENHRSDQTLIYPAIPEKEATPVDIDLSMSNSNMSGEYSRRTNAGKEIEVIDLENDSALEDKADNNSERKTETMFTGLEGFPNHTQSSVHVPDVQDNYDGLMITQLLNTFPDCPDVQEVDINPLQNEMGLHNGEGTLGDDDSIYMSLGEIPLSFLRGWEDQPPPQGYEKPF